MYAFMKSSKKLNYIIILKVTSMNIAYSISSIK